MVAEFGVQWEGAAGRLTADLPIPAGAMGVRFIVNIMTGVGKLALNLSP